MDNTAREVLTEALSDEQPDMAAAVAAMSDLQLERLIADAFKSLGLTKEA